MKTFAEELMSEMSSMGIKTFQEAEKADSDVKKITPLTARLMNKMGSLLSKQIDTHNAPVVNISPVSSPDRPESVIMQTFETLGLHENR